MNYSIWAYLNRPLAEFNRANLALALVFRVVIAGAAAIFLFMAIHNLYFGDTSSWREIQATVTDNSAHNGDPTVYTPNLSYQVEGKTYTGEGTQARENQYTVGSQITIEVNPDNPTDIWQRDPAGYQKIVTVGLAVAITVPFITIGFKTASQFIELLRARRS